MRIVCLVSIVALSAVASADRGFETRWAIRSYMHENGVVGATVAIAEREEIVFQHGFGYADLENLVLAKPETVYRLASISKPITAVGIMQLVERGLLDLDKDIREYVPDFPDKGPTITARHVLCHVSGIRHYRGNESASMSAYSGVADSLRIFKDDPLVHPPGERSTYSTYAYQLLAAAIESVTGKDYPTFMRESVFAPAGMGATDREDMRAIVPNRARGYAAGPAGEPRNSAYADMSYKWAGGGLVSTAPDLCRLGIALLNGTLLKPETMRDMWTLQRMNDGSAFGFGLGWRIGRLDGRQMISHTGAQQQVRTILMIFPEQETVIAVLTNYESHNVSAMGQLVARTWFAASQ